jgi:hypothetical protein
LDTTIGSGNDVNFALSPNQPSEASVLGATSNAPKYNSTATGSVYAVFYCPDATTCGNVAPQLLYSGAIGVPISWDTELWTQWSAEGIDDGGAHRVSLAIYNEDTAATSYTVRVYDSTGSLAGTGTTPSIPPLQALGNGSLGEGGTYGALLSDVIATRLPAGIFKILVDGGSKYSAVEVLQFNGLSATALQVGYDSAPGSSSRGALVGRPNLRSARVASRPRQAFGALER